MMVYATVDIKEHENRMLNIIKGKFGLKNKSEAINFVIDKYEKEFLEAELKPKYIKKIEQIKTKDKSINFSSIDDLRHIIESEDEL